MNEIDADTGKNIYRGPLLTKTVIRWYNQTFKKKDFVDNEKNASDFRKKLIVFLFEYEKKAAQTHEEFNRISVIRIIEEFTRTKIPLRFYMAPL